MNILEELNLQHSINLKSDNEMLLESEAHILNEVSEFGIDNVYKLTKITNHAKKFF